MPSGSETNDKTLCFVNRCIMHRNMCIAGMLTVCGLVRACICAKYYTHNYMRRWINKGGALAVDYSTATSVTVTLVQVLEQCCSSTLMHPHILVHVHCACTYVHM